MCHLTFRRASIPTSVRFLYTALELFDNTTAAPMQIIIMAIFGVDPVGDGQPNRPPGSETPEEDKKEEKKEEKKEAGKEEGKGKEQNKNDDTKDLSDQGDTIQESKSTQSERLPDEKQRDKESCEKGKDQGGVLGQAPSTGMVPLNVWCRTASSRTRDCHWSVQLGKQIPTCVWIDRITDLVRFRSVSRRRKGDGCGNYSSLLQQHPEGRSDSCRLQRHRYDE